jgi:Leucine-rich repeat (LRR) protein
MTRLCFLVVVWCAISTPSIAQPPKEKYGGISPETVEAWKKAKWQFNWFSMKRTSGNLNLGPVTPPYDEVVPGFRSGLLLKERIDHLPTPNVPFGLELFSATDDSMEKIRGIKNLRALDVTGSSATEAGWRRLAELPDLEALSIASGKPLSDKSLGEIGALKQLKILYYSPKITKAGLKEIVRLEQLEGLFLSQVKLSDDDAKELARLTKLQCLSVDCDKFSGAGLKDLATLKSLRRLGIRGAKITDADLKSVTALERLEMLVLSQTPTSDAGLAFVAELKNLRNLVLDGTKTTDDGLKALAPLKKLESLSLSYTSISDASIETLAKHRSLRFLYVYGTKFTSAGLKQLRSKHGACVITPFP